MASKVSRSCSEWDARIDALERSGLSVGEFAAREGVHPGALALARARRRRDAGEESPLALSFVSVEPKESRAASVAAPPFEIGLAGGRLVRVWCGFDAVELVRLVSALEGGS